MITTTALTKSYGKAPVVRDVSLHCEPGTITGSIGVFGMKLVTGGVYEKFGLKTEVVSRGKNSGAGSTLTKWSESEDGLTYDFVLRQAQLFADRIQEAAPRDAEAQIRTAYAIALSRPPTDDEIRLALDFLKKEKLVDFAHVMLNLNEFVYMR